MGSGSFASTQGIFSSLFPQQSPSRGGEEVGHSPADFFPVVRFCSLRETSLPKATKPSKGDPARLKPTN